MLYRSAEESDNPFNKSQGKSFASNINNIKKDILNEYYLNTNESHISDVELSGVNLRPLPKD